MPTIGPETFDGGHAFVVGQSSYRPADGDDAVMVKIYRAPLASARRAPQAPLMVGAEDRRVSVGAGELCDVTWNDSGALTPPA
jgi:hypothetical protein